MSGWSNSTIVRLIRMGENELQALIERVISEAHESSNAQPSDRAFSYRKDDCVIHLQQPGDSSSKAYLVSTLSLSAQDITMLHGSFVHNGSRCMCQLIGTRGDWAEVYGKIVSCRHVQGNVHEICMHFDSAIDPIRYCPEANRTRVLLAEDDAPSTRLATPARTLKGEADGYGFDPLSEAADKLVQELNAGASKETIGRLMNDVASGACWSASAHSNLLKKRRTRKPTF